MRASTGDTRPTEQPTLAVQRAGPGDLVHVMPLFEAYRAFYDKAPAWEAAATFLADRVARHQSVILMARVVTAGGGESLALAGFAQLYRAFSSLSLGETMILNDLYVAPAWRRFGAARMLVEASIAHARAEGALRLELSTQHANKPARALYDSLGFVADEDFAQLSLSLRASGGA